MDPKSEALSAHRKYLGVIFQQKEDEYKKAQSDIIRFDELLNKYLDLTISRVRRSSLYCSASINPREDLEVSDYNSCSCCPDYEYGVQLRLNDIHTYPPNIYIGVKYSREPDLAAIEKQMDEMGLAESVKNKVREFVNNFKTFDNDDEDSETDEEY